MSWGHLKNRHKKGGRLIFTCFINISLSFRNLFKSLKLKNTFNYLNDDIHNIYEFVEIYRSPMSGLILKIRASVLAEFSFINNITEIDHNFGAPAAGRSH